MLAGCSGSMYSIKPGDSLSALASMCKPAALSVQQITEVNPQITDPNKINAGDSLCLPKNCMIAGEPLVECTENKCAGLCAQPTLLHQIAHHIQEHCLHGEPMCKQI